MRSLSGRSHQGFTIVEIVVVVCVVGIIAAVGYVWWQGRQDVSVSSHSNQSSSSAQPTPTPTPDPTAGWKTFAQKDGYYTFKYPATWTITGDIQGSQFDGLEYVELRANDQIVMTATRYLDGTGCSDDPQVREVYVGATKVQAKAYCGSQLYDVMTTINSLPHNDKTAGFQVKVMYDFQYGHSQELDMVGKSLTGLTPSQ